MMPSNRFSDGVPVYNPDDDSDESSSECIYVLSEDRHKLDVNLEEHPPPSKIICTSGVSSSHATHITHSPQQMINTPSYQSTGSSSSFFLGRLKKNNTLKTSISSNNKPRHHAWMKSAPINHSDTSSHRSSSSSSSSSSLSSPSQTSQNGTSQSSIPFTSYKRSAPARPLDDGDEIDSDVEEIFPTRQLPNSISQSISSTTTTTTSRLKAIPKMPHPAPSPFLMNNRPSTIQSMMIKPLKTPLNFQAYRSTTTIPPPQPISVTHIEDDDLEDLVDTVMEANNIHKAAVENIKHLQEEARKRFIPSSLISSRNKTSSSSSSSSTFDSYHKYSIIHIESPEEKAQRIQARLDAMPLADQPTGVKTTLHKHQRQALNWLLARENDGMQFPHNDMQSFETSIQLDSTVTKPVGVKGSILADDMGLGKTLELISLMVARPVPLTLIVCPMALLKQWKDQINQHAIASLFKVVQYYGPNPNRDSLLSSAIISDRLELRACWPKVASTSSTARRSNKSQIFDDIIRDIAPATSLIVITTYGMLLGGSAEEDEDEEVLTSMTTTMKVKKRKKPTTSRKHSKKKNSSDEECINPLLAINWDRLIMDEAQAMKNIKAKTTKAAIQLKWTFGHLLTGTPLQNKIAEFQSLMSVLKHPRYSDISKWESDMTYSPDSSKNMSSLMDAITLRRVKEQKILGDVIVSLPPVTYHDVPISLVVGSTEEVFYSAVESKICDEFNAIVNKYGEKMAMKNYTYILVLLLRLRQVACHPYLFAISNLYHGDEGKKRKRHKQKSTNSLLDVKLLDAFCSRFIEAYKESVENGSIGMSSYDDDDDDGIMVVYKGIQEVSGNGNADDMIARLGCDEEVVDEPLHTEGYQEEDSRQSSSYAKRILPPIFDDIVPNDEDGSDDGVEPTLDYDEEEDCSSELRESTGNDIIVKDHEYEEGDASSSALQLIQQPDHCQYMSSKLKFAMDIVTRTATESPDDKIVIFSLFDGFLDVIQYHLQKLLPPSIRGSRISRIDGKTINSARDDIITNFKLKSTASHRIILLALKAAGVGLDLSVANHILIMDPWWNSAIERQAQDRVNRIGQRKPVSVYKFVLKGSVEERIALIQAKKESMIQAAMGDVTLLPPERLTFANISIMLKPIVRK